jgi:DNA-binding response OmpR family regulator
VQGLVCDPDDVATTELSCPGRVLIVDDDTTVTEVMCAYLQREGYLVATASDGHEGLDAAGRLRPDLVVTDVMMPGMDGLTLLRQLRALEVPVILLTARSTETDRVTGLESGADDYVVKPFSPRELVARVAAVLRRSSAAVRTEDARLSAGPIEVDLAGRRVEVRGEAVGFTAREFDLLAFFMRNPGQAFRRDELLERVWGYTIGDKSTVTVHVRHVREKIEEDPGRPTMLVTVWSVGYRFDLPPDDPPPDDPPESPD